MVVVLVLWGGVGGGFGAGSGVGGGVGGAEHHWRASGGRTAPGEFGQVVVQHHRGQLGRETVQGDGGAGRGLV